MSVVLPCVGLADRELGSIGDHTLLEEFYELALKDLTSSIRSPVA